MVRTSIYMGNVVAAMIGVKKKKKAQVLCIRTIKLSFGRRAPGFSAHSGNKGSVSLCSVTYGCKGTWIWLNVPTALGITHVVLVLQSCRIQELCQGISHSDFRGSLREARQSAPERGSEIAKIKDERAVTLSKVESN